MATAEQELPSAPLGFAHHLPWQNEVWQRWGAFVQGERLPHALLISGERGIGKYQFALALTQLILCQQPSQGVACQQCQSCKLSHDGHHPDLLPIGPTADSATIGIDVARSIRSWLQNKSHQGGARVLLVKDADALNLYAQNTLLKTFEEPGAKTYFILVSDAPYQLLPTVRSRCQTISLHLPSTEDSLAWLAETAGLKADEVGALMEYAHGRPLLALEMHSNKYPERHKKALNMWRQLLDQSCVASAAAEGLTQALGVGALDWILEWLSSCARFACAPSTISAGSPEHKEALAHSTNILHYDQFNHLIEKGLTARGITLSGHNPNMQLLLESLLVECLDLMVQNQRAAAKKAS